GAAGPGGRWAAAAPRVAPSLGVDRGVARSPAPPHTSRERAPLRRASGAAPSPRSARNGPHLESARRRPTRLINAARGAVDADAGNRLGKWRIAPSTTCFPHEGAHGRRNPHETGRSVSPFASPNQGWGGGSAPALVPGCPIVARGEAREIYPNGVPGMARWL